MHEESLKNQLTELEERMVNSMPNGKVMLSAQDTTLSRTFSSQESVRFDGYPPLTPPEESQSVVLPSFRDLTQATNSEEVLSMAGERLLDLNCHCTRNHLEAHSRTCFYSLKSRKRRVIVGQAHLFNFLLQCKITVQYSRHAFYRDLGISPNFTLRATRAKSIALDIILNTQYEIYKATPEEVKKCLRNCLVSVRQSFLDGHAWPTDISTTGINLLHVRNSVMWTWIQLKRNSDGLHCSQHKPFRPNSGDILPIPQGTHRSGRSNKRWESVSVISLIIWLLFSSAISP